MNELMNIFMNLAKEHTAAHIPSLESDLYIGVQVGLEKAMVAMAELPELRDDDAVKSIAERLTHGLPALPLPEGSREAE